MMTSYAYGSIQSHRRREYWFLFKINSDYVTVVDDYDGNSIHYHRATWGDEDVRGMLIMLHDRAVVVAMECPQHEQPYVEEVV